MNTNSNVVLVTGATGHQGGASARRLLANGWRVRALVRNPDDPAARALADKGVEIVQGDMTDRASLDRAMRGVYGVHSVQAYMPKDAAGEIRQGTNVADAAKAAGVQHLVYSSAAGPEDPSELDVPEIRVVSLDCLDGIVKSAPCLVFSPGQMMTVQRGYHELGNALLSKSLLPLLWCSFRQRSVSQKRQQSRTATGLVPRLWPKCWHSLRHGVLGFEC
jgi:NAD(P)-dependent dehydrogenase (short-subunit alcohol dehydrogenase family)